MSEVPLYSCVCKRAREFRHISMNSFRELPPYADTLSNVRRGRALLLPPARLLPTRGPPHQHWFGRGKGGQEARQGARTAYGLSKDWYSQRALLLRPARLLPPSTRALVIRGARVCKAHRILYVRTTTSQKCAAVPRRARRFFYHSTLGSRAS